MDALARIERLYLRYMLAHLSEDRIQRATTAEAVYRLAGQPLGESEAAQALWFESRCWTTRN